MLTILPGYTPSFNLQHGLMLREGGGGGGGGGGGHGVAGGGGGHGIVGGGLGGAGSNS